MTCGNYRHHLDTKITLALLPLVLVGGVVLFGCLMLAFCAQLFGVGFVGQACLLWLALFGFLLVMMACFMRGAALSCPPAGHLGGLKAFTLAVYQKLPMSFLLIYIPPRAKT